MKIKNNFVPEIKVSYSSKMKMEDAQVIRSSRDAAKIFRSFYGEGEMEFREHAYLLLLNRRNKVKGCFHLGIGSVSGVFVDPKVIFAVALKTMTSAIMICHNHPSGATYPSEPDLALTRKLKEAGKVLEIPLLDHIILTKSDYTSMADRGLM